MTAKSNVFIFAIILMLVAGCTQAPTSPSSTQQVIKTPFGTPTISVNTPVPTETNTIVSPITNSPFDKCLSVESNYRSDLAFTGSLILTGTVDIGNDLVRYTDYKIDMETVEKIELSKPGENIFNVSISPDGNWMAYEKYVLESESDDLIISDIEGKHQKVISWKNEWTYIASWLDSKRLMIGIDGASNSDGSVSVPSFLVFNPFTGEHQTLKPDLSDVFETVDFSGLTGRSYNPELDRIVYLEGDMGFIKPPHYILWDITQQQSLASFEMIIQPTALPAWSPDGKSFGLAASIKEDIFQTWPAYELYRVGRDGQTTQLTHLTDYYPWVYIEDYSWSPDGKYIAFWFSWWSGENPGWDLFARRYLALVDTENGQVTNYCIEGKPANSGRMPLPVWSPGGGQLAMESPISEGGSQVVIIDMESRHAFQVGENMTPVGWMVAP
ncbi:MAG: PD40 domain-containing protein [Chloroflexi bacterium]|nr:PD40 domain-containing protein [Chloroflexota bacterium]